MNEENTHFGADTTQPATPLRAFLQSGALLDGRFQVLKLAGAGGMGEVYKAWDTVLERHVALKTVHTEEGDAHIKRFKQEAQTLARLNHPGICQAYDLVSTEVGTFLTMEWVEGRTLDRAGKELDQRQRLVVAQEIADALAAAHLKGLAHRDLKPLNLMLDGEGHVKILDFGLARLSSEGEDAPVSQLDRLFHSRSANSALIGEGELPTGYYTDIAERMGNRSGHMTHLGFFMGSPRYASPEQLRGELAGTPSDIFSLGIVIWELLLGEHPFQGEGRTRLHAVVADERKSARGRLPRRLAKLLEAMLAPKREDRPTAAVVAAALMQYLHPRHTAKWMILSVAATLLTVSLGYYLLGRGIIADLTRARPARLAILPTVNHTGDAALSNRLKWAVPEIISSSLRNTSKLSMVPPEALHRALSELPQNQPDNPDLNQLAKHLGAELYLVCSMSQNAPERQLAFNYRLQDRSGRVRLEGIESGSLDGSSVSALFQKLPRRASAKILQAIDPLDRSKQKGLPDELSSEALDAYSEGMELIDQGRFKEALIPLRLAAVSAPWFSTAAVTLGICLFRTGDPSSELAIQWGRWAAHASGNPRDELTALINMGLQKRDQGCWKESQKFLEEALQLAQTRGEKDNEAEIHNNLGLLFMDTHHPLEAEPHLQQALDLERSLGIQDEEAQTLNNLAVLAKERGDFEIARSHYQTVLQVSRHLNNRWTESMVLNNLGDVAISRGQLAEAETFFQESLQLKRVIGNRGGEIIPLANLGILSRIQKQWTRALAYLNEALALSREMKRRPLEAAVLFQLSEVYRAQGERLRALTKQQEAARLHAELADDSALAQDLAGQADCLFPQSRVKAESLLKEAQAKESENVFVLRTQAKLRAAAGHPAEARRDLNRAIALARRLAPEEILELQELLAGIS